MSGRSDGLRIRISMVGGYMWKDKRRLGCVVKRCCARLVVAVCESEVWILEAATDNLALPYVFSGGAAFNDIHAPPPGQLLLAGTGTAFVPTGALVSAYNTSGAAPEAPPRTTQRGLDLDA